MPGARAQEATTLVERLPAIVYRMHARDGSVVWVRDESARVLDEEGRLLVEGLLTDIKERKTGEDRLQHLADHDALTDLLNRRRFLEELELLAELGVDLAQGFHVGRPRPPAEV